MTVLETFEAHEGRLIDRWQHYFPLYERHFARFVGTPVRMLEIGIGHGGGLQMWKAYFGPLAEIVGVDIDPRCKEYEEERISIHIADQADLPLMGRFDVIVDDGSHVLTDQQASLNVLWPALRDGGVYWVEDCHTGEYPKVKASSSCYYPWVCVFEKSEEHTSRVIKGRPSRPLNAAEISAYGAL